jgi:DNA-binding LytR/AlgR family response regulator
MAPSRLNVLVVEDDPVISEDIVAQLNSLGFRPWGPASSLEVAKGYVVRGPVDLVLVDIHLEGRHDGIALGHWLKEHGDIPHVFLTANADSATVELAKKTTPMGFVVKPFQTSDLYSSIEVARANWALLSSRVEGQPQTGEIFRGKNQNLNLLFVPCDGKHIRLYIDEIVRIASAHVYSEFHMQSGLVHVVRCSLQSLEGVLPSNRFIRVHRSHMVNVSYIDQIEGKRILIHGTQVPISRVNKEELLRKYPSMARLGKG